MTDDPIFQSPYFMPGDPPLPEIPPDPPEPPPRPLKRWLWVLFTLIVFLLLVVVCVVLVVKIMAKKAALDNAKAQVKVEKKVANVAVLTVQPGVIRDRLSLPAVVTPFTTLEVKAEVGGKIIEKPVDQGQSVKKGAVLVRLDPQDYRLEQSAAEAAYKAALAAKKRIEKLYREQLATRAQYDDLVAQVDRLKSSRKMAARNVGRTTVRTPMGGTVDCTMVENGQFIDRGQPVARIIRMDRVKVVVGIPESDVDDVRRLTDFDVTIDALNNRLFTGSRHFLSATANDQARLYTLEIAVENPGGVILPDMFARVEIVKQEISDALRVPLYAVISQAGENHVFLAKEDVARRQVVQLGIRSGWQVAVTEGLQAGDEVIVVGQRDVGEGAEINVIRRVAAIEEIKP